MALNPSPQFPNLSRLANGNLASVPDTGGGSTPSGSPEIISVSGTFAAGSTVTVEGSGFGSKDSGQATPMIPVQNWSGATEGQLLSDFDSSWIAYQTQQGGLITLLDGVDGSGCAYTDTTRHDFDTNHRSFTPSKKMFCSSWYKVEGANNESAVIKFKRSSSSSAAGGGGVYNGAGRHTLSNWNPALNGGPQIVIGSGNGNMGDPFGGTGKYVAVVENEWMRIDYEIILSDPGQNNGLFAFEVLGLDSGEYPDIMNRESGFDFLMDTLLLGLMPANNTGSTLTIKEDLVYADTSFCRVEIGDNADYSLCSNRRILNTASWSDGQVAAVCPHDMVPGTYTVFLVTEDRQKAAYEVTI